jgi:DNA-binding LytR/AlgR family response regulator
MLNNFFVRCDGKYIRIDMRDIRYLKSMKNYVSIVTISKSYMVLISLTQLEKALPASHFCRVHRSFIVSLHYINSFDHENVYFNDIAIPINPVYKNVLPSKVKVLLSDTRTKMVNQ